MPPKQYPMDQRDKECPDRHRSDRFPNILEDSRAGHRNGVVPPIFAGIALLTGQASQQSRFAHNYILYPPGRLLPGGHPPQPLLPPARLLGLPILLGDDVELLLERLGHLVDFAVGARCALASAAAAAAAARGFIVRLETFDVGFRW